MGVKNENRRWDFLNNELFIKTIVRYSAFVVRPGPGSAENRASVLFFCWTGGSARWALVQKGEDGVVGDRPSLFFDFSTLYNLISSQ